MVYNLLPRLYSNTTSGAQLLTLTHGSEIYDVEFSTKGNQLGSAGLSDVTIWNVKSGDRRLHLKNGGYGLTFSPDDELIASAGRIWETKSGRETLSLRGGREDVDYAFSPDGKRLAAADEHGNVKVWDVSNGLEVLTLRSRAEEIANVVFSPDGTRLAATSSDGNIKIWDATPLAK